MLCKSPLLTPAALTARRANALKSTGPRTARGKARSCLNALRHGCRARDLRAKIERTGDRQALCLFDWFHVNLIERFRPSNPYAWDYTRREAGRVWCFMTGRMLLPRLKGDGMRTGPGPCTTYRYGDSLVCPTDLRITDNYGRGIQFWNPAPSRRKRVRDSWVPRVEFLQIPLRLPRAKRVRGKAAGSAVAAEVLKSAPDYRNDMQTKLGSDLQSGVCLENPRAAGPVAAEVLKSAPDCRNDVQTKLRCDVESGACLENPGPADPMVSASDFLLPFELEDCEGMSAEELLARIRWGTALLDSLHQWDDP